MPSRAGSSSRTNFSVKKSAKRANSLTDPAITPQLIEEHGLTPEEFDRIKKILGRAPNFTELGIFSVMWSEHCSYKSSRPQLKKFPTTGERVLVRAGEENAGVIDVGDGWGVAFKIESHNHPSAVEPFQGAATGVGGILRDIFTMGARPIFNLNSLRFGEIRGHTPQARTNRRLLAGVVSGIGHYGNCIGVPTVGGEVCFDSSYDGNPLVNAFSLGILRHDQIRRGAAEGIGNPIFYVGARTGRDGLAAAAFASRDLDENSHEDRPAVQVGDPFMEKLLLEACLELFEHPEAVVGVQDMGAAGLTCSTCETAARGGTGVEIDLMHVPRREDGMTPYETMLSESQERMLIIVRKGHEKTVQRIFQKWDLPVAEIGKVTADGVMRVKDYGRVVSEIPAKQLADEAPIYHRPSKRPAGLDVAQQFDLASIPEPSSGQVRGILLRMIGSPNLCSRRWIYRQYDHTVRAGTIVAPGSDAAVVRFATGNPDHPWKYLASTVDGNGRYCALDPYLGGKIAVAEAARNLAVTGAVPIAATDNLNFGNPMQPEIFWQLEQAVDGIAEACRAFGTPVTGGNVSLYNQSPAGAIDPTPTLGMVGLIEDERHITTAFFKNEGDEIVLLGDWGWEIAASNYLQEIHGLKRGRPPEMDLERERRLHDCVRAMIRAGLVRSAHDLSDGGFASAVVESCVGAYAPSVPLGARVRLPANVRLDVALFNETQGRILLSVGPGQLEELSALARQYDIAVDRIGAVGGSELVLERGSQSFAWPLEELVQTWGQGLDRVMG